MSDDDKNGKNIKGQERIADGGMADQMSVAIRNKLKNAAPPLYKVLMLNDDYTPMDFVVYILESYFDKPSEEAKNIMLSVHNEGFGVCGVFTRDIADTKAQMVIDFAKAHGHPLLCRIEQA